MDIKRSFFKSKSSNDTLHEKSTIFTSKKIVIQRVFKNKTAVFGVLIISLILFICFFGPLFFDYGEYDIFFVDAQGKEYVSSGNDHYDRQDLRILSLSPPSKTHIFGTDKDGRDIFVRLMYGGRVSLSLGILVVIMQILIGTFLGSIAGYYGKWIDIIIMRVVDILDCIPLMPVMLIISSMVIAFKVPHGLRIYILMLIVSLLFWTSISKLVRGQVMALKEQDFILTAEAMGVSDLRKIFFHIIPNVLPQLIVLATLSFGNVILLESALSYFGVGVSFPHASWGNMINYISDPFIIGHYYHLWIPPVLFLLFTVIGFNLIGDGLRDAFDPKIKN